MKPKTPMKTLPRMILKAIGMTALVMAGKTVAADIHKPLNDPRDQMSFKLSNGLSVLVISDPTTDKAAAAMNIGIGSNADPEDRPGLAHFLEHMLFLGTSKYPEAGSYQSFIQSHGGQMNAYTAYENTNYFFDIEADSLEPALDRFAQFFIAPLLDEKYVDRERHAVHSEFQSRIRDDRRRSFSVLKQVMNPEHRFSHFSTGSMKTLQGDVRSDLLDFYNQYYSSNMMTLVIEGKESLPELKAMAERMFSAVPNKHAKPVTSNAPLFRQDTLPARLTIKTLKESNKLTLTFPVSSVRDHWHEKPLQYIADMVGYEGQGSLLSYLKQEGLAETLGAATSVDLQDQAVFKVQMMLTPKGMKKQDRIIESFFAYIEMVKQQGIKQELYQEQSQIRSTEFRYAQKFTPLKEVSRLATMLQRYPAEHVYDATYLMDSFAPQKIKDYLSQLSPDNMLIISHSKDARTDQTDPWYKTDYKLEQLTERDLRHWNKPDRIADLNIRSKNPFIADNLEVKPLDDPDTGSAPEVVFQRNGLTLWHLQDTEFDTPKADTYFSLASPHVNDSAKNAIAAALYTQLVKDQLNEQLYDAQLAGLKTRIYSNMRGITVRMSGYSDKQAELLKTITQAMKQPELDSRRFRLLKNQLRTKLANAKKEKPYNQTTQEIFRLLLPQWSSEEKLAALQKVSLSDVKRLIPKVFSEHSIKMMTHGNLSVDESIALSHIVENSFIPGQEKVTRVISPVVRLKKDRQLVQTLDIKHNDSAISVYFQGQDTDVKTHAQYRLMNEIAASPFYQTLRTEKQLGYIVFGTPLTLGNAPGLAFVVQSPVAEPLALEQHIQAFVEDLGGNIDAISQEHLNQFKQSLIAKLLKQDKNLTARSNRFWKDIEEEDLQFDSHQALAQAVASLSLEDLKDCFRTMAARQLVVRSFGQKHQAESATARKERCDTEVRKLKRRGEYFEA